MMPTFPTREQQPFTTAMSRSRRPGRCLEFPLPLIDGLRAATAQVLGLTLVTRSVAAIATAGAMLLDSFRDCRAFHSSPCSNEQVGHDHENPGLCNEPTDRPHARRREGVGGNIKQPGDDEYPGANRRP